MAVDLVNRNNTFSIRYITDTHDAGTHTAQSHRPEARTACPAVPAQHLCSGTAATETCMRLMVFVDRALQLHASSLYSLLPYRL